MKSKKITLLTFNVQGVPSYSKKTLSRLVKVAEQLNKTSADIINIQEAFTYKHLEIIRSGLTNFPYISLSRGIIGPCGGLITFSKKPFLGSKFISYSFLELLKHGLFKVFRRNLLSGKGILMSKVSGNIFIINTHLIANSTNDWNSSQAFYNIYKGQIATIGKTIDSVEDKDVIITSGDFNIPKDGQLYSEIVNSLHSYDVFENEDRPTFHRAFLPSNELGHRLDYVFVNSKILPYKVVCKDNLFSDKLFPETINHGYLSDHIALIATFVIESP